MPGPFRQQTGTEEKPRPAGYSVKGGSRGLTVEYRELMAAGEKLAEAAGRLHDLELRGVKTYLHLYTASSGLPAREQLAAEAVNTAVRLLTRVLHELEDTARGLGKAGQGYLEVEGRVEDMMHGLAAVPLSIAAWGAGGWGYPDRIVSELLVPEHSWVAIKSLLGLLEGGRYGKLRPIDVIALEGDHGTVALDRSARGLLDRSRVLQDGPDRGVVEILTVEEEGQRVRIVTLPGTQDGGSVFVGANPFDPYGNAEARAEDSQYVAEAVAEALRQAGASAEDAVILVGYSQGGIHAVNTGARLVEAGEFSVEMIVTAGSPAGDRDTPEGVKVIHFEHYQDWVPGADGASNPDLPDRITVTGRTPEFGAGGLDGLGPAHQLDVYLELAELADGSEDPSVRDSLGYLAEVIPSGAIATRGLFRFSRKPAFRPSKGLGSAARCPAPVPSPSPQAPPAPPLPGAPTPLPARPGQ